MTLEERVYALSEAGLDFPLVCAILDLTPAQVNEVLSGAEPSLPSGGGGSAALFSASIQVDVEAGGDTWGADGAVVLPAATDGIKPVTVGAVMVPEKITPGEGNGIYFQVQMPDFSAGQILASANLTVANADSSERLGFFIQDADISAHAGGWWEPDMTTWEPHIHTNAGADLKLAANGRTIDSVAGGWYMAQANVGYKTIGLVP